METKTMLDEIMAILKAQNKQVKMGNGEILLRHDGQTYMINPCNQEGSALIAKALILNVDNIAGMGAIWGSAMKHYQSDPTYDDWNANGLNLTMPPNQGTGPKRCILWMKYAQYEDLKMVLTPEELKGQLEALRILSEYILKSKE